MAKPTKEQIEYEAKRTSDIIGVQAVLDAAPAPQPTEKTPRWRVNTITGETEKLTRVK